MHPNRLLFSCFLLYFLIPNIGIQISLCTDDHPSYSNCNSSFNCGDITGVGYPFWGDGRSSNCGHPAFKLHCSGNSTSIQIMSQWFRVKQIELENQILKIARADFVEGLCPKRLKDTTIDFNLFSYTTSDENATLFYRCASTPIVSMAPNSFTCEADGDDGLSTAYFFPTTVPPKIEQLGLCKIRVTVPILQETARAIMREALENPGTKLSIGEALKKGFEVQWSVDMEGCRGCIKAGGYCGYNWSLNGFTCFCNNQSNGRSCSVPPASVISTISTATHNAGMYSSLV